ncbi:MAG: hypothetical protein GF401_17105 [Chitinivibrionales bacterium]|nr:hypothetical protein [Chitinivibrionales bacterium]
MIFRSFNHSLPTRKMIYRILSVKLLLLALFICTCTHNPSGPDQKETYAGTFNYTVFIPSMPQDSLRIVIEITDRAMMEDSLCFALPPVYADNPLLDETGNNVHNIIVYDSSGNTIGHTIDSMQIGPKKNGILTFEDIHAPVTVEYTVTFNYIDSAFMPPPYIGENTGYCAGHYLFAIPLASRELAHIWRDRRDISLDYVLGNAIHLRGDGPDNVEYSNAYELLFSTFALGGEELIWGTWGGQEFGIVSLSSEISLTASFVVSIENTVATLLSDITGSFMPLNHPLTAMLGVVEGGGIEGYHAFAVMRPDPDDTLGVFNMVLTHEILHSWIGVRVGDWEDPWFKEGITNYLGFLITKRNNYCSREYLESVLLKDLSDSPDVQDYALSDPSNRIWLFTGPDSRTELVYVKGAQVAMLLDRRLRRGPAGVSLDEIIGAFVAACDGRAFYRSEWVEFMESSAGSAVDDIFAEYVDKPGAIPDSVLQENYLWLGNHGAFGDFVLAKKRPCGDALADIVKW